MYAYGHQKAYQIRPIEFNKGNKDVRDLSAEHYVNSQKMKDKTDLHHVSLFFIYLFVIICYNNCNDIYRKEM